MMRRRGDKRHAWCRISKFRNHFCDFETRKLPAFARLGALRDFNFNFAALVEIFRCYAKSPRRDLLHSGVWVVAIGQRFIPRAVFAAFARHGFGPDAVHGDVQSSVCFGRKRAQ